MEMNDQSLVPIDPHPATQSDVKAPITDEQRQEIARKAGKTMTPLKERANLANLKKAQDTNRARTLQNKMDTLKAELAKTKYELATLQKTIKTSVEEAVSLAVEEMKVKQGTMKQAVLTDMLGLWDYVGGAPRFKRMMDKSASNEREGFKMMWGGLPKVLDKISDPDSGRRTGGIQVHIHGLHKEPIHIKAKEDDEEETLIVNP